MNGAICCVLRAGGDFTPAHVDWLEEQCREIMPDWHFLCWSDEPTPRDSVPLKSDWPKWWAKMEIYGPNSPVCGMPTLIVDIDSVFLKPLVIKPEHQSSAIFLRDPYRDGFRAPVRVAGGFTYMPAKLREHVWQVWVDIGPERVMQLAAGDDQIFFDGIFTDLRTHGDGCMFWQDEYPDHLVSYKAQVRSLGIRPENRVVYFHGKPRPWEVCADWIPKLQEIDCART